MQELNRLDQSTEKPAYSDARIAQLHQDGLLSRSEAEVLDIIYTGFAQGQEEAGETETDEQWEPSCVAIVHEGEIIPILNIEEIIQRPGPPSEKRVICKRAANILYDVLLTLLEEEAGGKSNG